MNLILFTPDAFVSSGRIRLCDRAFRHATEVQKIEAGVHLRVGLVNGRWGQGVVRSIGTDSLEMDVQLDRSPPPPLPLTLLLALPRPKMLKRILQHVTSLGVKRVVLMNSARVEKSFWRSPWLDSGKIHEQLLLGLEQAVDTILPTVVMEQRFRPFVEDRLPKYLADGAQGIVAHPGVARPCPHRFNRPAVLAVGPEGGFVPFEVDLLKQQGFSAVHIGPRILRVESAVTAIVSKMYD